MIIDDIRARITEAVKAGDGAARDILRLALGEIQTLEARTNQPLSDEQAAAVVRKLVKANEETVALTGEGAQAATLRRENEVLSALLPKRLSVEELVGALASQRDAVRAAKTDGQATGVAMKHLKSTGASFDGADVATAVKSLRA